MGPVTLFDYQQTAVNRAISEKRLALFMDQGSGKSHCVCGVIDSLHSETLVVLLVVPLANVETTWARLLAREVPDVTVVREWDDLKRTSGPKLMLIHYEMMPKLIKKIQKVAWTLVVFDESQRLKERGTKASRCAARIKSAEYRLILSGTPIEQAPQDLWAQFRFLDPELLGTRWADFDAEWLRPCGFMGYDREFLWKKLPKFIELVTPRILRVLKTDVLDLPSIRLIPSPVELLGEQARVYRDLERNMVTTVGGQTVICDLKITQIVRLQQVAGGFIRTADGESIRVGQAKLRRLRRLLLRETKPIVIFTKYREELEDVVELVKQLGFTVGIVDGSTRKTRSSIVESFQRGELDVLVAQIRTGGVGLDLFRACVAIVYSATFSSIDFDQALARIHRYGQTRDVRVYTIPASDTVDSTIELMIATKRRVAHQVLDNTPRPGKQQRTQSTMAKDKPAKAEPAKTEAPAKKQAPPQPPKPKYGIPELAEAMGTKAASIRVQLRKLNVAKSGKLYGWETKDAFQAVVSKLKDAKKAKPKAAKKDDEEETEEEDEEEK